MLIRDSNKRTMATSRVGKSIFRRKKDRGVTTSSVNRCDDRRKGNLGVTIPRRCTSCKMSYSTRKG